MHVSVDGFASAGPNDPQEWVTWALEDIYNDVLALGDSTDTILIGRKLAVDYIPYWTETLKNPADPMHAFAERIVAARKIIFSKTLTQAEWENTEISAGDLGDSVRQLKAEAGKDIIVYGGTEFVSNLIAEGLIDEFHFFVNPVALGKGEPVFSARESWQSLKLERCKSFPSGLVLLVYSKA